MKNYESNFEYSNNDSRLVDSFLEKNKKARSDKRRQREKSKEISKPFKKIALIMAGIAISGLIAYNSIDVKAVKSDEEHKQPKYKASEIDKNKPSNSEIKSEDKNIENPFDYDDELWLGIKKYSEKYNLPTDFTTAIIQQESHGDSSLKSEDGFNSYGATQSSLNYHFSKFTPALEQAGLLSELINKPASEVTEEDNESMLQSLSEMSENSALYKNIISVFCDIDVNLDIGFDYLSQMLEKVKKDYPDITDEKKQLSLAAMNYNGGPGAANDYMNEKQTPASKNYTQYEQLVMSYYKEINDMKDIQNQEK